MNGRWVTIFLGAAVLSCVAGCVSTASTVRPPAAADVDTAVPEATAADDAAPVSSRSFFIRGRTFAVGQAASLRVCVTPAGVISSVELLRSSGEARFDEFAMVWARQADVSHWVKKDQRKSSCGLVRVEIGQGPRGRPDHGPDTALG